MALAIVQPAPLDTAMRLAFRSGRAPRRHVQAMLMQVARSETMAFVDRHGEAVMVVGLWQWPPLNEGERFFELWLLIDHAALPHLPTLRRLARLMLARVAESGPVRIRALVAEGHRPGSRMCALVGMRHAGTSDGFEAWDWES
jgi:hypothetical protein